MNKKKIIVIASIVGLSVLAVLIGFFVSKKYNTNSNKTESKVKVEKQITTSDMIKNYVKTVKELNEEQNDLIQTIKVKMKKINNLDNKVKKTEKNINNNLQNNSVVIKYYWKNNTIKKINDIIDFNK